MKHSKTHSEAFVLLFAAALFLLLLASVFTASSSEASAASVPGADESTVVTEDALSDSYIRVSEALFAQGISNGTCYEDYVSGYRFGTVTDLAAYETQVIEAEKVAEVERQELVTQNTAPAADEAYQQAIAQREAGLLTEEEYETLAEYETLLEKVTSSGWNVSFSYEDYLTMTGSAELEDLTALLDAEE